MGSDEEVGVGGCDCDCAQCDNGSHCGNAGNGCRFFEDEEDEEDEEDD